MRRTPLVLATCLALAAPVASGVPGLIGSAGAVTGTADRAGAPTARVAVDQSYPRPGSGAYTVRGHGYGHGRGMSQWGAQGAALEGLDHEQILAFYYPGTEVARAPRKVRVLVTADTTSDVVVENRDDLVLRDRGTGTSYALPNAPSRWRVLPGAGNRDVVEYVDGGSWRSWRPGGEAALVGEGEFRAKGPVTLVTPSGTTTYRGWLRAARPSEGSTSRDTVNVVRLDDYVRGVVPAEVYTSWRPEALQAQAVAARTYAAFERAAYVDRHYQICDTSSCQVYGGEDAEVASTNAAVEATARQMLTSGGEPAFTQFSASSGGWTAQGSFPYLPAKADPYDGTASNPVHDWSTRLSVTAIQNRWPSVGRLERIRVTARDGNGAWQGRVETLRVVGSRGSVTVSGDTFRFAFGLRSTWFTLS